MIVNCKEIAEKIIDSIKSDVLKLKKKGIKPHLAIIKANDNPSSEKYVNNKVKKGLELGIDVTVFKENLKSENDFLKLIDKLNNDIIIHGIIVQLPLYKNINSESIIKKIIYTKDVDGFSYETTAKLWNGSKDFFPSPCTAYGIIKIFEYLNYNLEGKDVVIINRSNIVGKPLAGLLLRKNATVTLCHSKTKNIPLHTKKADVVIVGVGIAKFLSREFVNKNTFVIDVGINVDKDKKICGDADFADLKDYVSYITPVPNGVGQLTVAMVYRNLLDLILKRE